jgi:hypothetical protein
MTSLDNLLEQLREGRDLCSFECDSILFGALTKEMYVQHLLPRQAPPFQGRSFVETIASIHSIRSPEWFSSYYNRHDCSLRTYIDPIVDSLEECTDGLALSDFDRALVERDDEDT